MDIGLSEAVAFVYTFGVLVSGVWLLAPDAVALSPVQLLAMGGIALLWTAYFSWTVKDRIVDIETEDEDDEEGDGPGPTDAAEGAEAGL